ncbi:bpX6 domain-containing protein [Hyalangium sp.]|uniref:bpX6 domain-containing protein n=1 Tax=Hyalangium sp. TaxID=2028555 RepID=UPI002D63128C|nr:bpX6 domain-containing protein [Hyalangium sp.]HYH98915.1 bpX6 domain-containing protein [Hyalangium sp.]
MRPRLHLHRGKVVAVAFWFDPVLLGERGARMRVLAAWEPGTSVFVLAGGFLLRLSRARPVDCAAAPGLSLTLEEGVLLSAPLSAPERERLAPPPGSTVLVRAGRAEVFPGEPSRRLDVAAWLEVSGWTSLAVKGLGAPPPPVKVLEPLQTPPRSLFQGIPPPDPEAEAMRARMEGSSVPRGLQRADAAPAGSLWARLRAWLRGEKAAPAEAVKAASATPVSPTPTAPSAVGRFVSWLRRTLRPSGAATPARPALPSGKGATARSGEAQSAVSLSWLRRLLGRLRQALSPRAPASSTSSSGTGRSAPTEPATPPPPQGPGLFSRLSEWLLRNTPLGPLLGQRKAEYVQRLFEMFEQGNLTEALRYAIPLGDEKMSEQARIALGLPGPRESLTIQPQRGGAASLFGGGQEVYAALKERYRAAFQRLEREGRIDEAAFVLTELLGAHEEAVSFLEKHGRLKLAAELAEGRGLAPGLVVRQWLLAKDIQRAVAIARRSGAFPDAVLRLERTHPAEARTLRLLWAETLAEAGDYMRAAVVVWPLEDARPLARAWLEQGATVGGVGGARALARLIAAFPDSFEENRPQALELLEDDSQARSAERLAFSEVLASESRSEPRTALVGPSVRALLRDRASGHTRIDSTFLMRLMRDVGDGALRADLPPISDPRRRNWAEDTGAALLRERIAATEAGPYPIHDAVALSGQRMLLALGEAGVRLVRADGTRVAHFDVPAFWLVPSVHEDRVLALAPRGELKRISRIEPGPQRAAHWCDAKVDAFAPSYDGNLWFLAEQDTVMAVDALATEGLRALWRVAQVGGRVMALEADAEWLRFAIWSSSDPQLWTYSLPGGPTLRSRAARRQGDGLPLVTQDEVTGRVERRDDFLSSPPWTLVKLQTGEGHEVKLASKGDTQRAHFVFEGEVRVQARFSGGELLLFDTAGRLLRVDLAEGTARRVLVQ